LEPNLLWIPDPQSPGIESPDGLAVEDKIDLEDLAMVIAGAVDCGCRCRRIATAFVEPAFQQAASGTGIAAKRFLKNGWM
jgi:hypothetical protein